LAPGIYETKWLSRDTGATSTRASRQRPAAFRMGINGQQRTIRHPFHRMMCSHSYVMRHNDLKGILLRPVGRNLDSF
jgi:hypothetical protein